MSRKVPKVWANPRSRMLYYRWDVPERYRIAFGTTSIRRSLETTDPAEAQRRNIQHHAQTLAVLDRLEKQGAESNLNNVERAVDKYFAIAEKKFGSLDEFCRTAMMMMFLDEQQQVQTKHKRLWCRKHLVLRSTRSLWTSSDQ